MSMSGWCSSSSATSATAFTKSMAPVKSSNSKVRSMCFFSNSHSGILFMRSFSSGAFIKSAITGQRVTPENRFAMPKRVSLNAQDFAQIFHRIEDFDRTCARLVRAAWPARKQIFDRRDRGLQTSNKMKTAPARQILCRTHVLGYYWPSHGQKSCRAIAQPTGFPAHIDPFNGGEFTKGARQVATIFRRCSRYAMWIDNMPAALSQSITLGIFRIHVHREFEFRFGYAFREVEILFERVLLR